MEELKLEKVKAEFVNLRRISLPIELEIKDWKAFERIYRPKGTPEEAKKLPTDNIAVRTDEEEALFEIPEIGYLTVKLGIGWSQTTPWRGPPEWRDEASVFLGVDLVFDVSDGSHFEAGCSSKVKGFDDEQDENIFPAARRC